MSTNGALQTAAVIAAPSLAGKLEFAILSVLIHYNGSYEETLPDWYAALRLGLPELIDQDEVHDVFERLSAGGIVELKSSEPNDDGPFSSGSFTTTLTPRGLIYWSTVRIQPGQSSAY